MPVAATLRDDNIYYDRKFDQISYILSEFIDNALQHAVLEYRDRIKKAVGAAAVEEAKRRRPWIRLTILVKDDHVAFCGEDNGTGIKHESLGRALRKKVCACHVRGFELALRPPNPQPPRACRTRTRASRSSSSSTRTTTRASSTRSSLSTASA